MAVFTPELGATPLIHPSRIRLDSPSYSLTIARLETGDTGTCQTGRGAAKARCPE